MNLEILYVTLYAKDLRNVGSGNIGATNVLRAGKKSLGFLTLILDSLKGYMTVAATYYYFTDYIYLAALLSFLGHIFPVWLKFKGGKGIAVFLGILFAFSTNLGIIFSICWVLILYLTRYASVSSLVSIGIIFIYSIYLENSYKVMFFFISLIIAVYTHRENIVRLKKKKENKINL